MKKVKRVVKKVVKEEAKVVIKTSTTPVVTSFDSPKCLSCLKKGAVAQTYKVVGKPAFKCVTCKQTFPRDSFTPIEFTWKSDKDEFNRWLVSKGIKPL